MSLQTVKAWMIELMEKWWQGLTWREAVTEMKAWDKLQKPQQNGPYSIGKVDTNEVCRLCGGPVVGYFAGLQVHSSCHTIWGESTACQKCGHRLLDSSCKCNACKEREKIEQTRQLAEMDEYVINRAALHNDDIEFIDDIEDEQKAAILLAMLEQSTSEDLFIISPLQESFKPFAPSASMTSTAIDEVYYDYLQFAEYRPKTAVITNDDSLTWYSSQEPYRIRCNAIVPKQYLLNLFLEKEDNKFSSDFIAVDIYKLMYEEALECLRLYREEYYLPHSAGPKTRTVLEALVLERPLGEIFYIIWSCCKEAAAAVQKREIFRRQASNRIVGAIERQHRRAVAEDWNVRKSKRHNFAEQSWLSYAYFNMILGLASDGLDCSLMDVLMQLSTRNRFSEHGPFASYYPEAFSLFQRAYPKNDRTDH